jgi:hypothetical protein
MQRYRAATGVALTSKSAVSRVSKPASHVATNALPIWKSATQQVGKPAPRGFAKFRFHFVLFAPFGGWVLLFV